ncbi:hypothetical protein HHK36_030845 [Tetracentron sinense]|uniref:Uncharacterized protein n=1 Tax=Tetracentron sinense TaxID=13715 RepID=A0A835CYN8_TETSI|nr:hypothetical protein HHK36_030845 [Tetracentron sinense]
MGFEASRGTKMQEVKCHGPSLKPSKCMEVTSRHKRSKRLVFALLQCSDPDKRRVKEAILDSLETSYRLKLDMGQLNGYVETKKKKSSNTEVQNSLKQEIKQLEKQLQDHFVVRHALEKALGYRSSPHDISNENSIPKPTKELIKEVALLEMEVVYLEQYLLLLYRKAFDQQISSLSPSIMDERLKSPSITQKGMFMQASELDITPKSENSAVQYSRLQMPGGNAEKLLDSSIHRTHSSLSQRSACSTRPSPPVETLAKDAWSCHSQPLFMLEHAQSATSNVISLAEHFGTRISDHVPETPNRISEDMIKCVTAIYGKLAYPPLVHHGISSSPISSLSSMSVFSPQDQCDMWSPQFRKDSTFDRRLENPFPVEGLNDFSGPYSTMAEVPWICRDSQDLSNIEPMLQNFRSLVCRLEEVDPRQMKHEEKLAFWINVHNVLVMHVTIVSLEDINHMMAFLVYGIPQNAMKRVSLLLKAAYNVGGHTISVNMIQSSILGCHMPRPGKWLRLLFSPRKKFKPGDDRQEYAIEHPEPLLYFALCSGGHSDPAVRIYTPKRVFQELEAAKEEYIWATFGVRKEQKILLPKIVECFAKDLGLCPVGVVEMIQHCMPETLRKSIQRCQQGKSRKSIEWIPHNFAFRYLISKELVK